MGGSGKSLECMSSKTSRAMSSSSDEYTPTGKYKCSQKNILLSCDISLKRCSTKSGKSFGGGGSMEDWGWCKLNVNKGQLGEC